MKIKKDEYGDYYDRYVKLSNNVPLIELLRANSKEMNIIFKGLTDENSLYRYDENKWTLKEVFGHLTDTERIFNYRALSLARGEPKELPGFDQDLYVKNAKFATRPFTRLQEEYKSTRKSTIALFSAFTDDELTRRGTINGATFTVRAAGYVIAGHELHHLNIINERYLPGLTRE